jgi:hypothetical protein
LAIWLATWPQHWLSCPPTEGSFTACAPAVEAKLNTTAAENIPIVPRMDFFLYFRESQLYLSYIRSTGTVADLMISLKMIFRQENGTLNLK